jgi:hypothetical protein
MARTCRSVRIFVRRLVFFFLPTERSDGARSTREKCAAFFAA